MRSGNKAVFAALAATFGTGMALAQGPAAMVEDRPVLLGEPYSVAGVTYRPADPAARSAAKKITVGTDRPTETRLRGCVVRRRKNRRSGPTDQPTLCLPRVARRKIYCSRHRPTDQPEETQTA